KGAGNGFPVSAVVVSDRIAQRLAENWKFHLSSHQSDPLPAVALGAVIDVVQEQNLLSAAVEKGAYFKRGLQQLAEIYPAVQQVRGIGLMLGFDVVGDGDAVHWFMLNCRRRGVHVTYTFASPTIRILPPLTITTTEIDVALSVFGEVLEQMRRNDPELKKAAPRNPYTARLMSRGGWSQRLTHILETSPQYWLSKLRERL